MTHCSESSRPVLVKTKGILILMVYAFPINFISCDLYLQIDNYKIVGVKKIYQKVEKTVCLWLPQFHSLTGCDTISHFFSVSKTSAFQRLLKVVSGVRFMEELQLEKT